MRLRRNLPSASPKAAGRIRAHPAMKHVDKTSCFAHTATCWLYPPNCCDFCFTARRNSLGSTGVLLLVRFTLHIPLRITSEGNQQEYLNALACAMILQSASSTLGVPPEAECPALIEQMSLVNPWIAVSSCRGRVRMVGLHGIWMILHDRIHVACVS